MGNALGSVMKILQTGFPHLNPELFEGSTMGHLETFPLSVPRVTMLDRDPDGSSNESAVI